MSDDVDAIAAKLARLKEQAADGQIDQTRIGGEIARLTFAKQKAERRELEASIRRRARLNRGK